MTPAELATLLAATGALLTGIGSLVVALVTAFRLTAVHEAVNGQSHALVALTRSAAFAEGVLAEKDSPGTVGKLPAADRVELPMTD